MHTTFFSTAGALKVFAVMLGLMILMVLPAEAATSTPACSLYYLHNGSITETKSTASITVAQKDLVGLLWNGVNVSSGVDKTNKNIPLLGVEVIQPTRNVSYAYTFTQGSERVTCSIDIKVISGSVSNKTTAKSGEKISLTGKTDGVTTVALAFYTPGVTSAVYTTNDITVKSNKFTFKMPRTLNDGTYRIELQTTGSKPLLLATSTVTIGIAPAVAQTALVVQKIPLLAGGIVKPGSGVAVSYLQVINVGSVPANVTGFSLSQVGSAPASIMTGVTITDELGTSRGSVGNMVSGTPFSGTSVNVPLTTTLAPKESRLFTVRAVIAAGATANLGQTISLSLLNVSANARVQSALPVTGVVWTIGQ